MARNAISRIFTPNTAAKRHPSPIKTGKVLDGSLPPAKMKLVQAWLEIHRDELFADWELVINGSEPFIIDPLK